MYLYLESADVSPMGLWDFFQVNIRMSHLFPVRVL